MRRGQLFTRRGGCAAPGARTWSRRDRTLRRRHRGDRGWRRTLAHALAPSGRRILLLERGDFLPREMANWDPGRVFVEETYISPDTWYDPDGQPFQPQVHYFVGGATKMYRGRPVPAAAGRLRRDPLPRVGLRPGRWATTSSSPGTPRRSGTTRCRAPTARPHRGALVEGLPVARRLARAADPAAGRCPGRPGLPPVPRGVRDPAGGGRPAPCWTPTARRTISTTSTWSTRASSPASAP